MAALAKDLAANADMLRARRAEITDLANRAAESAKAGGLITETYAYETLAKQLTHAANLINRAVEICSDGSEVTRTLTDYLDADAAVRKVAGEAAVTS